MLTHNSAYERSKIYKTKGNILNIQPKNFNNRNEIYHHSRYTRTSVGMTVRVIVPVVFLMTCTTWLCDMLARESPLIFKISSPECSLPSSAAMLFGAMLRM